MVPAISTGMQRVLARMHPARRQWLVDEALRAAELVSTPAQAGELHRTIGVRQGTWPVLSAEKESHLVGLYAAVAETAGVDGAIVECGVGRGGSLVPLARANQIHSPDRQVFGFDSFEGFPAGGADDIGPRMDADGTYVDQAMWCSNTSTDAVRAALGDAPCELVAGFFSDTLPGSMPERISILHVDCDLYESTRDVLAIGLPRVQPGGMVILDEYREQEMWPGATKAIDEAFAATPHEPAWDDLLHRYVVRMPPA